MAPRSRRGFLRRAGGALAAASPVGAAGVARAGETPTDATPANRTAPAVEFDDQQADDGRRVAVQRAVLPDGGFVAVHDGAPTGDVVGHTGYLPPGTHRDVRVVLGADHEVTEPTTLSAVLWRDATGDGDLDYAFAPADEPYLVDDEPVFATAAVSGPTPTPAPTPTETPSPTPTASPSPPPTASSTVTSADSAIPGFGVGGALVAAGVGALAARLRNR